MPNGYSIALDALDKGMGERTTTTLRTQGDEENKEEWSGLERLKRTKTLSVWCCTWNMHGKSWPRDLRRELFGETTGTSRGGLRHDVYAIGTQECQRSIAASAVLPSKKKWERALCEALGPTHVMIASKTLQAIHIAVFVHREIRPLVERTRPRVASVSCGKSVMGLGRMGNKGGVGVHVSIGSTRFAFVNCHLAAHQHRVKRRNHDFSRIDERLFASFEPRSAREQHRPRWKRLLCARRVHPVASARASPINTLTSLRSDVEHVIWMGDFNYRVDHPSPERVIEMIDRFDHDETVRSQLVERDQMTAERRRGGENVAPFARLSEGPLQFKPTYKFVAGTDRYERKKRRVPSWTDRVLYKKSRAVRLVSYDSLRNVRTSDHRPVVATFKYEISV